MSRKTPGGEKIKKTLSRPPQPIILFFQIFKMMVRRSIGIRHDNAHQSHFSFGNRTGLINANHGGAAQSLGGQKISHQAMIMKKPLHPDSQYGGPGYDEPLGNGRNGHR